MWMPSLHPINPAIWRCSLSAISEAQVLTSRGASAPYAFSGTDGREDHSTSSCGSESESSLPPSRERRLEPPTRAPLLVVLRAGSSPRALPDFALHSLREPDGETGSAAPCASDRLLSAGKPAASEPFVWVPLFGWASACRSCRQMVHERCVRMCMCPVSAHASSSTQLASTRSCTCKAPAGDFRVRGIAFPDVPPSPSIANMSMSTFSLSSSTLLLGRTFSIDAHSGT